MYLYSYYVGCLYNQYGCILFNVISYYFPVYTFLSPLPFLFGFIHIDLVGNPRSPPMCVLLLFVEANGDRRKIYRLVDTYILKLTNRVWKNFNFGEKTNRDIVKEYKLYIYTYILY